MRFEFIADEHVKVKTFLKKHEVSKGLLAKIKFRGGAILVNDQPQNATYLLDIGDRVVIDIPAEEGFETLEAIERPLDILYEDDHFLVLNKPMEWLLFLVSTTPIPLPILSRVTMSSKTMKISRFTL